MFGNTQQPRYCGCWFPISHNGLVQRQYLPQVNLTSKTSILATTSRTILEQTFSNSEDNQLDEVQYTFPLYDGVSIVGFDCTVAGKTIVGVVKPREQARADYQEAVARGEAASLLEQLPEASDVFTTSIGNVPPHQDVKVKVVYLGELKHDAETDGSRFTIPTNIAPRYGSSSHESSQTLNNSSAHHDSKIEILVDVTLDESTAVRGIQSPSHPIAVTMGRTSAMNHDDFTSNNASATLALGSHHLDQDFIIIVLAKGVDTPRALLETHSNLPDRRAIMATLVPRFNLPNISPEIVFVVDRSGSMNGKMPVLITALRVFLKSLPVGVKFNICSFGSGHSFLFQKSKTYDQYSLKEALHAVEDFAADFGGTEMLQPIVKTIENRYKDLPLEVMVLTDGQIWNQAELFTFIQNTNNARFFSLGIGAGASSALVEGIARAGNGFAQFVAENEKLDKRTVRMLKGALTPHVTDYSLSIKYSSGDSTSVGDDFEIIEPLTIQETVTPKEKKPISLFDTNAIEEAPNKATSRFDHLPMIEPPNALQAPYKIPSLFPFSRSTVYMLLGPDSPKEIPVSITLRGNTDLGPLELEIPVQDVGKGETINQLAARKAIRELEDGGGWLTGLKNAQGQPLNSTHEGKWDLIVEREAVRLGEEYQVSGRWCSFVAVAQHSEEKEGTLTSMPIRISSQSHQSQASAPAKKKQIRSAHGRRVGANNPPLATFPASPAPASLFGNIAAPSAALPPGSAGTALFGAPAHPSPPPGSAGAALFGAPAPPSSGTVDCCRTSSSSLFGSSSATAPKSASSFGGFGQASSNTGSLFSMNSAVPPPPPSTGGGGGGGLFGAKSAPPMQFQTQTPVMRPRAAPVVTRAPRPLCSFGPPSFNPDSSGDSLDGAGAGPRRRAMGSDWKNSETASPTDDCAPTSNSEKLHWLIDLQEFDGHWEASEQLWKLLGVDSSSLSESTGPTACALAWLKKVVPEEEEKHDDFLTSCVMHLSSFIICSIAGLGAASVASVKPSSSVKKDVRAASSGTTTTKTTAKATTTPTTSTKSGTSPLTSYFVDIVQSEVSHPVDFCNYYLSNGLTQSLSASDYLTAKALTLGCQSLVPKVQTQPKLSSASGKPVCDQSAYSAIAKEFTSPTVFCKYWTTSLQTFLPLTALTTLTQVNNGCQCAITVSSSTSSNKPSSTIAKAGSTSHSAATSSSGHSTSKGLTDHPSSTSSGSHLTASSHSTSTTSVAASTGTNSPPFYLRLKSNADSGTSFNGYYVNPLRFDQDNANTGQYLAVTKAIPSDPFVLSPTGDLVLQNNTVTGKSGFFSGYSGYMQIPLALYFDSAGSEVLNWTWNRNNNTMKISTGYFGNSGISDFHNTFATCTEWTDGFLTLWESWTRPAQPLFIGPNNFDCTNWDMEVIPASTVTPASPATTQSLALPTSTTNTTGWTYSAPFYLKLVGDSNNGTMNYAGYYLSFFNLTTGTGNKDMFMGVTKTKPSAAFVLNQNNYLVQLNNTFYGTPGFVSTQDTTDSTLLIHMRSFLPGQWGLTWDLAYDSSFKPKSISMSFQGNTQSPTTCPPSDDRHGPWSSKVLSTQPVTIGSGKGCLSWGMTIEMA
ncbi:hypothetical protein K461DRAFT_318910 [Myriangium duriaei CBS 260.36]|uniref:VWFA domain-containing protein n=1 Tax=Myriangium duriaei CBS 260.36 TaxID=1168546 RepID=A0A9P4J936_9PEZI|nr:hypothetical protein K461DRAFT_318910 [Myriangium duriaei CBS 260.36]